MDSQTRLFKGETHIAAKFHLVRCPSFVCFMLILLLCFTAPVHAQDQSTNAHTKEKRAQLKERLKRIDQQIKEEEAKRKSLSQEIEGLKQSQKQNKEKLVAAEEKRRQLKTMLRAHVNKPLLSPFLYQNESNALTDRLFSAQESSRSSKLIHDRIIWVFKHYAKNMGIEPNDITLAIFEGRFNPHPKDLDLVWKGLGDSVLDELSDEERQRLKKRGLITPEGAWKNSYFTTNYLDQQRHKRWVKHFGSLSKSGGDATVRTIVDGKSKEVTANDLALRMMIKHHEVKGFGFGSSSAVTYKQAKNVVASKSERAKKIFADYMAEAHGRLNPVLFFDLRYHNFPNFGDREKGFQTFTDYQALIKRFLAFPD